MARIAFTSHLEAVGPIDLVAYEGKTVAELLETVAADYPRIKSYVLDDQGRVRKHIIIFIDGTMRQRETVLSMPLSPTSEVYVLQALSGGSAA